MKLKLTKKGRRGIFHAIQHYHHKKKKQEKMYHGNEKSLREKVNMNLL